MARAATVRPQLRGSRIASSSQSASSSKAACVSSVSRVSIRSDSESDSSTGARAERSRASMSKPASAILKLLLELANRAVDQDLGRTLCPPERAGYLAVVPVEGKAHDQRRLPVLGERRDAGEHLAHLLAALDELVGTVALGERPGVVEVRLGPP